MNEDLLTAALNIRGAREAINMDKDIRVLLQSKLLSHTYNHNENWNHNWNENTNVFVSIENGCLTLINTKNNEIIGKRIHYKESDGIVNISIQSDNTLCVKVDYFDDAEFEPMKVDIISTQHPLEAIYLLKYKNGNALGILCKEVKREKI